MTKKTVVLAESLDPANWEEHEVLDVREFLISRFHQFPSTARIYHEEVTEEHNVTPVDEAGIERLGELPGPFYVIVYPSGLAGVMAAVALAAAVYAITRKPPKPSAYAPASPNNEMSERKNEARPLGRIPDIFGTVRSVPDLLSVPYSVYEWVDRTDNSPIPEHREVEYAYMCIGRGEYQIEHVRNAAGVESDQYDVRDSATLIEAVEGAAVEVYGPNTSPGSGTPQLVIGRVDGNGRAIQEPLYSVTRCEAVNGQKMEIPNREWGSQGHNVRYVRPNRIELRPWSGVGFLGSFSVGDSISLEGAAFIRGYYSTGGWYTWAWGWEGIYRVKVCTRADPQPPGAPTGTANWEEWNSYVWLFDHAGAWWRYVPGMEGGGEVAYSSPDTYYPMDQTGLTPGVYDGQMKSDLWNGVPYYRAWLVAREPSPISLSGQYTVTTVANMYLLLDNPAAVNPNWNQLPTVASDGDYMPARIVCSSARWIGADPFVPGGPAGFFLDAPDADKIQVNFVAPQGLYFDDGEDSWAANVSVRVEVTPVERDGRTPRGPTETLPSLAESNAPPEWNELPPPIGTGGQTAWWLFGHKDYRNERAFTFRGTPTVKGPWLVRACRTDHRPYFKGTASYEVRWRDLFGMRAVTAEERAGFGDVTTIHTATCKTTGALAVKERKLTALVTRKVKCRGQGTLDADGFSTELLPTRSAADILVALCRDPRIGNRLLSELDLDSIYSAVQKVQGYFGSVLATEFCYTFDREGTSFEETVAMVAEAVFCVAYRGGGNSRLKLSFEKETQDSVLLFNHRNKIPGTEARTVSFGTPEDFDGVEYEWVDPSDDAVLPMYFGRLGYQNANLTNPKKVKSIGVRNGLQAYFHAARLWNELCYQCVAIEFEATQEAALLVQSDRFLCADNTRPETQDGEVVAQNVLELTLSRPVSFAAGQTYTIFLQHVDGTVEQMPVTAGSASDRVVLDHAPRRALALESGLYARATFIIVRDDDPREQAFLLAEKEPQGFTTIVRGVNYDARYYQNDADYVNGVVDENGIVTAAGGGPSTAEAMAFSRSGAQNTIHYSADSITWVQRSAPTGDLLYSPLVNSRLLWTGTRWLVALQHLGGDNSSACTVYSSQDNGQSWGSVLTGPTVDTITAMAANTSGNALVFCYYGAHVSSDGGATWSYYAINRSLAPWTGVGNVQAVVRAGTRWLVAAGAQGSSSPAIRYSDDGGASWSAATGFTTGTGANTGLGYNGREIILVHSDTIWRSTDLGASWAQVASGTSLWAPIWNGVAWLVPSSAGVALRSSNGTDWYEQVGPAEFTAAGSPQAALGQGFLLGATARVFRGPAVSPVWTDCALPNAVGNVKTVATKYVPAPA